MAKFFCAKIDLKKIDKERLYTGKKGTYLEISGFINDEEDEYGQFGMITQAITTEESEEGVVGEILGNVTLVRDVREKSKKSAPAKKSATKGKSAPTKKRAVEVDEDDGLPF